jgi:hypothetical protein
MASYKKNIIAVTTQMSGDKSSIIIETNENWANRWCKRNWIITE